MNILYLSYDGLTDPLGQSQVLPYLFGLEKAGYQFTILSFEKPGRFRKHKKNIQNQLKGRKIEWIPKVYHKKPPVLSTMRDIWVMQKTAKHICHTRQIELVHCRSYIAGLVGLNLKKGLEVHFLFDIRGFWADERVDGGLWNLSNPLYKWIYTFFKRKEIVMMKGADHIISLTQLGKEEMVSGKLFRADVKIPVQNITVIPCAVDLELFDPRQIDQKKLSSLKRKLGIQEKDLIMIYLGSLGTWYLLDEMLFLKSIF